MSKKSHTTCDPEDRPFDYIMGWVLFVVMFLALFLLGTGFVLMTLDMAHVIELKSK